VQHDVRAFARRLMNRRSADAPIVNLATTTEVEFFERTSEDGPTVSRFRVSLEKLASSWNKRAGEAFASKFVGLGHYHCQDEAFIQRAFLTHLRYLRRVYLRQQLLQSTICESANEDQRRMSRNARRRYVSTFPSHLWHSLIASRPAHLALETAYQSMFDPPRS
jgi:hypothetical protein